ncbi:FAD-binding domain-containing protein [Polyplosphaeria fusca]|uniref:FAD-binding domain-containing protein n=1 Tax=Polyplosphaeria fusca TaxID=682080 RepID=A0A9P4QNK9_9PLEO|nr:FAD-binding domain-containing protein [Polyplosphaeria fusca]
MAIISGPWNLLPSLALCYLYAQVFAHGVPNDPTGFPPCDALIKAGLADRLLLPTSPAYEPRVESWWSANARLRPWCLVQPQTTQEVSTIVTALSRAGGGAGDWHIAVRSGGHGPAGSNNIANGVTIDLGMMNRSSLDQTQNLASLEPGAAWKDVYFDLLHKGNVTVTGGRDGGVGVGGFLLGGGNSFYTGRSGFGCDTVINYEVVLANGSITTANLTQNPDLYKALKGGGLNFGIVTRFDVQTLPAVDLAYGQSILSTNYSGLVLDAVNDFTDQPETVAADDALVTAFTHTPGVGQTILVIRANTRGNLNSSSFGRITSIPAMKTSWAVMSMADAANKSQIDAGSLNTQVTGTFLNVPSTLLNVVALHTDLISTLSSRIGAENFTSALFIQPIPTYFRSAGHRNGGNILGLDRIAGNAILWTCGVGILNGDEAALAVAKMELNALSAALKARSIQKGADVDFVYLNYAEGMQDPLGSYGEENVAFLKGVASKYDPNSWWQTRVPGGFKVSRVGV